MMTDHEIPFNRRSSIVITNAYLDGRETDIFIDDGMIVAIGREDPGFRRDAGIEIDAGGSIAFPGLVNTHTHAAMTLLRGYADDMVLFNWLSEKIWPLEAHLTGDDVYWGTRLACLEMIRTGTIAFNDMYFFMERAADAVEEAGIRACLSHGFIDLFNPEKREIEIKATEALHRDIRSRNNQRLSFAVGPHALYTVSAEGLQWAAGYAEEHDCGIHIHLSETRQELEDCLRNHGIRPAAYLDSRGILTSRTIAAHCCWLDDDECRLLGERKTRVSHNPSSNMKLASGPAIPYRALQEAGSKITLGTDGCASNNNLDLFEEMKTASLLQKYATGDPTILPAAEAVRMATLAGAEALKTGGGIIAPGYAADIILIDRDAICQTPFHQGISNIVYACNGGCVETVICDGAVLMHERQIPGSEEVLAHARKAAAGLLARRGE